MNFRGSGQPGKGTKRSGGFCDFSVAARKNRAPVYAGPEAGFSFGVTSDERRENGGEHEEDGGMAAWCVVGG